MNQPANPPPEENADHQRDPQEHQQGVPPPRPITRPSADPALAARFGRPQGVEGSFDRLRAPDPGPPDGGSGAAPPPESLAQAFGRPPGAEDIVLQRPHGDAGGAPDDRGDGTTASVNGNGRARWGPLWSSPDDPWRDPATGAVLGGPAVSDEDDRDSAAERPRGALLSLPEVLFGRRVKPVALTLLAVIALLVGAAGGAVGWGLASTGDELTGEVNLAEAQANKERPAGSIAGIAQRVAPAVVSIEVTTGQEGGVGSGVVIDPEGYIVTNNHVVAQATGEGETGVTAVFTDGTRAEARVVGTDPKTDLAVVKVNVSEPRALEIGQSSQLAAGDSVVAVGSPFGLENTVTQGIVSALNRPVTAPGENGQPPVTYDAIQTDAAINPGNSGGALVDSTGALVGINSLIRTSGEGEGGSIGLGFAIPVDQAMRISEALIADGEISHASLGVNAASVSANTSEGAQIQNVVVDGPAAGAGMSEGDVVTRVGERQVRNAAELTVAVREHEIGDVVPVRLVRGGRELTVDVTLGSD